MLLILSGYPSSGKSTVLDLVEDKISNIIRIDPKEYYPPEYEKADHKSRRDAAIAAWHVSLEDVKQDLKENPDAIIVYDTCAASEDPMVELINFAKRYKHRVVVAFVAANMDACIQRGQSREIISRYHEKFRDTLPSIKTLADSFVIIRNFDKEENINIDNLIELIRSTNG